MPCDVIITYCWNRVGYNILRSLSAQGLNVWAADTSKKNICSMSKYCSGYFRYPDPFNDERAFIDLLKEKVNELQPKVLLPTHDEALVILRHKEEFPSELIIPYPDYKLVADLSDKSIATKIAESVGVPVPRVFESVEQVDSYPVVVKTVLGNSAKGVFFPNSREELISITSKYQKNEILIEEWIGGTDYSVDCVRGDGFFFGSVYHALVTKTEGGGTTTQREIVDFPELVEYAHTMLDATDYKGVCGLDFRFDENNNRIAFIELNARYTGGLATPIAAGFDIPWIHYCLATTGTYTGPVSAKVGTKTKWVLGDIITLVDRIVHFKFDGGEMRKVFKLKGFGAFDDYRNDDRRAILGEMSYYLNKLIKSGKLNP